MKRILAGCLILTSLHVHAQTWSTTGNAGTTAGPNFVGTTDLQSLMLKTNGIQRLLIDPEGVFLFNSDYLKIQSRLFLQDASSSSLNNYTRGSIGNNIRWNGSTSMWKVESGPYDDFAMIRFDNNGHMGFYTRAMTGSSYEISHGSLFDYQRMFIDNAGNVGIATNDTKGYKLAVGGSAIFTSAKVKLQQNWPDYVFKKDYRLLSLADLEKFIQQNNHLPEIPSAEEVAKDGLDLGSNQAALLKKIEELTLYIIEQNKEMQQMKTQIKELENKVNDNSTTKQ
ncbi:MAG: hypothetical protein DI539_18600 [Flavobacterium psychrophilum]|nr:MAG: hypothetical protein DI539_18600 [Flavobacterium psychrophilum]